MGRNTTGPPWSVGLPTARSPGCRLVRPPADSVTDDDRRQTTCADRHQRAKQYWPIRRASNKSPLPLTDPRDAVPRAQRVFTDVDGQCDKL